MLTKVISGGQNGVDQAALRAAKALGIPTGGWMPKGWKTLDGPHPEFEQLYGMQEHSDWRYPARTAANVESSDATLRIAADFSTSGERCTLSAIGRHRKYSMDVNLTELDRPNTVRLVATWIKDRKPNVLNVAGNSELTAPGIGDKAYRFLTCVFHNVQQDVLQGK